MIWLHRIKLDCTGVLNDGRRPIPW